MLTNIFALGHYCTFPSGTFGYIYDWSNSPSLSTLHAISLDFFEVRDSRFVLESGEGAEKGKQLVTGRPNGWGLKKKQQKGITGARIASNNV